MNITFIILYVNVWSPDLGLCPVALLHATAKASSKLTGNMKWQSEFPALYNKGFDVFKQCIPYWLVDVCRLWC
jgi:hypothetical protein